VENVRPWKTFFSGKCPTKFVWDYGGKEVYVCIFQVSILLNSISDENFSDNFLYTNFQTKTTHTNLSVYYGQNLLFWGILKTYKFIIRNFNLTK
jgi:hypothetical protein